MPKSSLPEQPSMPKVVIDTNLFVRGLLKGPVTMPLMQAWKEHRFKLVTSHGGVGILGCFGVNQVVGTDFGGLGNPRRYNC